MADHHYRIQGQVASFTSAFQRQNNKPMPTEVGTEGGACESQRGKRQNQVFPTANLRDIDQWSSGLKVSKLNRSSRRSALQAENSILVQVRQSGLEVFKYTVVYQKALFIHTQQQEVMCIQQGDKKRPN